MHKNWCGKPCSECKTSCKLDESIPCSPDCPELGQDGEMNSDACKKCDSFINLEFYMSDLKYQCLSCKKKDCEYRGTKTTNGLPEGIKSYCYHGFERKW